MILARVRPAVLSRLDRVGRLVRREDGVGHKAIVDQGSRISVANVGDSCRRGGIPDNPYLKALLKKLTQVSLDACVTP
jgi:hypothetical protein